VDKNFNDYNFGTGFHLKKKEEFWISFDTFVKEPI